MGQDLFYLISNIRDESNKFRNYSALFARSLILLSVRPSGEIF